MTRHFYPQILSDNIDISDPKIASHIDNSKIGTSSSLELPSTTVPSVLPVFLLFILCYYYKQTFLKDSKALGGLKQLERQLK